MMRRQQIISILRVLLVIANGYEIFLPQIEIASRDVCHTYALSHFLPSLIVSLLPSFLLSSLNGVKSLIDKSKLCRQILLTSFVHRYTSELDKLGHSVIESSRKAIRDLIMSFA